MTKPIKVAITGAAGQIGYSLLFRIASGEVFGKDRSVIINLVELPQAMKAAQGTAMELDDCGFSTLAGINIADNPSKGFEDCNWALLVGSKPRGPGMERSDLIKENGNIFKAQGSALNNAASDVRIGVVGNPCNTNALIALHNSNDIPKERFSAMTMLDENRARAQLAAKAGVTVNCVSNMTVWGNHSSTMYPDFENALISGKSATEVITDRNWLENEFITTVQKRGAAIIAARGKSSAASAASACIDHVKNFVTKTPAGQVFSASLYSDGSAYDIPEGIMFSFPCQADGNGAVNVVRDISLTDFAKAKIDISTKELMHERELVQGLLK